MFALDCCLQSGAASASERASDAIVCFRILGMVNHRQVGMKGAECEVSACNPSCTLF